MSKSTTFFLKNTSHYAYVSMAAGKLNGYRVFIYVTCQTTFQQVKLTHELLFATEDMAQQLVLRINNRKKIKLDRWRWKAVPECYYKAFQAKPTCHLKTQLFHRIEY